MEHYCAMAYSKLQCEPLECNSVLSVEESLDKSIVTDNSRSQLNVAIKRLGEMVMKNRQTLLAPTNSLIKVLQQTVEKLMLPPHAVMAIVLSAHYFLEMANILQVNKPMPSHTNKTSTMALTTNVHQVSEETVEDTDTQPSVVRRLVIEVPLCHPDGGFCVNCSPPKHEAGKRCHGIIHR